jgi:hypothetical protein
MVGFPAYPPSQYGSLSISTARNIVRRQADASRTSTVISLFRKMRHLRSIRQPEARRSSRPLMSRRLPRYAVEILLEETIQYTPGKCPWEPPPCNARSTSSGFSTCFIRAPLVKQRRLLLELRRPWLIVEIRCSPRTCRRQQDDRQGLYVRRVCFSRHFGGFTSHTHCLAARSSPFLMTCRRFGSLTIGETTETESIAAVAGRPPAATCIAHAIRPRRHRAPPFRCCEN